MKTAVSIPDELFREAERVAEQRGMTRSSLYAEALRSYLFEEEWEPLDPVLQALQFEVLGDETWSDDGRLLSAGTRGAE